MKSEEIKSKFSDHSNFVLHFEVLAGLAVCALFSSLVINGSSKAFLAVPGSSVTQGARIFITAEHRFADS